MQVESDFNAQQEAHIASQAKLQVGRGWLM